MEKGILPRYMFHTPPTVPCPNARHKHSLSARLNHSLRSLVCVSGCKPFLNGAGRPGHDQRESCIKSRRTVYRKTVWFHKKNTHITIHPSRKKGPHMVTVSLLGGMSGFFMFHFIRFRVATGTTGTSECDICEMDPFNK